MDISIELLLNKRDYDTAAFTKQIIALFGKNLNQAINLIYKNDRDIQWKRIERFTLIPGYITLSGNVEVRVGDMLRTVDGEVLITDENVTAYTNSLRYVLKSSILQHGTVEDIYQHVTFVESMANAMNEEELITLLRSGVVCHSSAIADPNVEPILEKITRPTIFESFKTELLSDEQFASLRLNANAGKVRIQ